MCIWGQIALYAFDHPCRGRLVGNKDTFTEDERGAVALEMPIVCFFLMVFLLLPLADLAIAGFQFISAWQALRDFGQYVQYHSPPDPTDTAVWASKLPTSANTGYPISNLKVVCGSTDPCSDSTALPKYYSYTTTVTLSPMVLGKV